MAQYFGNMVCIWKYSEVHGERDLQIDANTHAGTYKPVPNTYSWVNLTNMVWVEQPVGTGFSQGTPTATNEAEVAAQFLGFFKNFVDTFAMEGFTVYITGESYAGYYVPYIADGKESQRGSAF